MNVLITGLTGSLGSAIARLHHARGDAVYGCARGELGVVDWLAQNQPLPAALLVSDAAKLADRTTDVGRLLPRMDRLYHCAAMKHVDLCEQHPEEAYRQNVALTGLVATACQDAGVPLVFVSSDKACLPQGVYGCTKLLAEGLVLRRGGAVVRLGNLIGSSGSVLASWRKAVEHGQPIKVTDPQMTRYFLSVQDAARFAADRHCVGKVAIPEPLRAARLGVVADCLQAQTGAPVQVMGSRPGETQHQWLVAPGERVRQEEGRLLLCSQGELLAEGLCSRTAPRWEPAELLDVALNGR